LRLRDEVLNEEVDGYVKEQFVKVSDEVLLDFSYRSFYGFYRGDNVFSDKGGLVSLVAVVEKQYEVLRELAIEGKMAILWANMYDEQLLNKINQRFRLDQYRNVVYESNVGDIIADRGRQMEALGIRENLRLLGNNNLFVDTTEAHDKLLYIHDKLPGYQATTLDNGLPGLTYSTETWNRYWDFIGRLKSGEGEVEDVDESMGLDYVVQVDKVKDHPLNQGFMERYEGWEFGYDPTQHRLSKKMFVHKMSESGQLNRIIDNKPLLNPESESKINLMIKLKERALYPGAGYDVDVVNRSPEVREWIFNDTGDGTSNELYLEGILQTMEFTNVLNFFRPKRQFKNLRIESNTIGQKIIVFEHDGVTKWILTDANNFLNYQYEEQIPLQIQEGFGVLYERGWSALFSFNYWSGQAFSENWEKEWMKIRENIIKKMTSKAVIYTGRDSMSYLPYSKLSIYGSLSIEYRWWLVRNFFKLRKDNYLLKGMFYPSVEDKVVKRSYTSQLSGLEFLLDKGVEGRYEIDFHKGKEVEVKQVEVEREMNLKVDENVELYLEIPPDEIEVKLEGGISAKGGQGRLVIQVPEEDGIWTEEDFGELVEAELVRQNIEASKGQIYIEWLDYERREKETIIGFEFGE
ncbi:MAG: hypothetical protein U9Q63_01095, partial [Patescibacteria group bacterium]|nr:hypothetical protein [Patescibacteria group bacterium]